MISYQTFITVNILYICGFSIYNFIKNYNHRKVMRDFENKYNKFVSQYNRRIINISNNYKKCTEDYCKLNEKNKKLIEKKNYFRNKIFLLEDRLNKKDKLIDKLKQNDIDKDAIIFNNDIYIKKIEDRLSIIEEECNERKFECIKLRKQI